MVYVKNNYCDVCHNKIATYGLPNGPRTKCTKHKTDQMINRSGKICIFPGCKIIPVFGYIRNQGLNCAAHKEGSMIDVVHDRCAYNGCNIFPSFNVSTNKTPRFCFCAEHKLPTMVNVIKKCSHPLGCEKVPSYGLTKEDSSINEIRDYKH